jgi:hypothetical protein
MTSALAWASVILRVALVTALAPTEQRHSSALTLSRSPSAWMFAVQKQIPKKIMKNFFMIYVPSITVL